MSLAEFAAVGLYDPDAPNAGERRELLEHLLERGFAVDDIIAAAAEVIPTHIAARLLRPWQPTLSLRMVAEQSGLALERLTAMRAALGFWPEDADKVCLPDFVVEQAEVFRYGCEQFGEDATLAFARVLGSSVARIIEASLAMFSTSVREQEATELQISLKNERANETWPAVRSVLASLLREGVSSDFSLLGSLLEGDARLAIGFVDLVGSTAWANRTSTSEHAPAVALFERHAADLAATNRVRLVKLIGDEAMFAALDPAAVARTACTLVAVTGREPSLPDARGGLAFGAVTVRDGDYYGPIVNLAARAAKAAAPGEVAATVDLADQLPDHAWHREPLEAVRLRGVPDATHLTRITIATM